MVFEGSWRGKIADNQRKKLGMICRIGKKRYLCSPFCTNVRGFYARK